MMTWRTGHPLARLLGHLAGRALAVLPFVMNVSSQGVLLV